MTRLALVIGLGGTGQWVLTHLKKDLIESNNGQIPDTVRLLCFDTLPQASAELAATTTSRNGGSQVEVGGIGLTRGAEFVHLGGDVYELSQQVRADSLLDQGQRRLPHIAAWFQAPHWLTNLPRASFMLASGAGQLRQFGRMALFKDLISPSQSEIGRRVEAAINYLVAKRIGDQRIEIIIVGSFAGGTGAGMFIDIALLARHRAKHTPNLIRGYFALPRAFAPNADDDMLARSFAAWRELNRFMVVSQDFGMPRLSYNSSESSLQITKIQNKVFDVCYLVDGIRNGARIPSDAELGVHPTIADAISAILDESAGEKYTEWVGTNLASHYSKYPGVPLYSVLGTHTFKVPIYYAQQDFTHRLTLRWLKELLDWRPHPDDPRRIILKIANPISPAVTGREESLLLLEARQGYHDPAATAPGGAAQSEEPTPFFNQVADIIRKKGADDTALIEQYARGSISRTGANWDVFIKIGNRHDLRELLDRIQQEARLTLATTIKTSKQIQEDPKDFPKRVERSLEPFVREHYGFRTADGQENSGKYGEALDECGQAHLKIFRRLVRLWLLQTLMSGDKSGRLGYARDLLDGLVDNLEAFLLFMNKVAGKRRELKPSIALEEASKRAKKAMEDYATRKWPPFLPIFTHPQTHASQERYLKAEQASIDTRKDEQLLDSVVQTIREMQGHTKQLREELDRWIRLLATGDTATDITGMFALLERQRRALDRVRQADQRLTEIQTRLDDLSYSEQLEQAELVRLMEGVMWQFEEHGNATHLRLEIAPAGESSAKLELPSGRESAEARKEVEQENLRTLQKYAAKRFNQVLQQTQVAERLLETYKKAEALSDTIGAKAEPLFDRQPGQEGSPAAISELIRINVEEVEPATRTFIVGGFDEHDQRLIEPGLIQERRRRRGLDLDVRSHDHLIQVVGSADTHKCTIVRTDDLMPVELFRSWHECQAAYLRNRKMPPHLNHNFPAEINAARYELLLRDKRRLQYRVFHPWVVMLLEHPERLEQFFLCWALGWIQARRDDPYAWYELNAATALEVNRPFMLTPKSKTRWSLFQVIHSFVLEGQDMTPDSDWTLNYGAIRTALEAEERKSEQHWLALLGSQKANTNGNGTGGGLAQMLLQRIQKLEDLQQRGAVLPTGEPNDYHRAYKDLADVASLMFEERLERKQLPLEAI